MSSVKPLQLLLAEIGGEAVSAELLQPAVLSPHDFQLRSSDMARLADADMIIWFGPVLEHYLSKPLRRFDNAVALYPEYAPGVVDPHFWLDVDEVCAVARRLARLLSDRLPSRSAYFHANAARFMSALRAYDSALAAQLAPSAGRQYLFLHDGFSRFEQRYQLAGGAVVMVDDHRLPGARHLVALRERLQRGDFDCVFREPQYPASTLRALVSGVDVAVIELDAMGRNIDKADGFLRLYRQLGEAFVSCFRAH
ncbi:metal ABC transporter solute-binding protein, Zn/Mn family [Spongiibacter sp.]|uniref:metal ABC transporter solute-binding protein, Zn/Mn family n=1 Tax=Spongiibacter sp. TaxID=2024860 RepID=UPI0035683B2B